MDHISNCSPEFTEVLSRKMGREYMRMREQIRRQQDQIHTLLSIHKEAADLAREKTVFHKLETDPEIYESPWKMIYGNTIVTDDDRELFVASFINAEVACYLLSMHNTNLVFKNALESQKRIDLNKAERITFRSKEGEQWNV
jgi:hypothetical protein